MEECDEVAEAILEKLSNKPITFEDAVKIVKEQCKGESFQVIDNIAYSLFQKSRKTTNEHTE